MPFLLVWAVFCAIGARAVSRGPDPGMALLLLAALAARAPWLGTPWHLSDDAWRFLWEGAALHAGHNPFAEAPAAIHGLDDALRARVNHPEITSIYPPFALVWFRVLQALGGTPLAAQLAALAADLVATWTLYRLADRAWPAWVWALHPLPAIESAGSAHLEAPALALCGVGLLAWRSGRADGAWLGLGGAALVKLLPALALPALLGRIREPRAALGIAGLAALGVAAAWPVLDAGPAPGAGFSAYARHWSFNGFAWPWVAPWAGPWSRPLLATVAGAWVARSLVVDRDPLAALAAAGSAFVLTSPTAHPWYGLWALWPSLALGRSGWAGAAAFLPCAYGVLSTWDPATGAWSEPAWLWWVTWPPAVLALAAGARAEAREPAATQP